MDGGADDGGSAGLSWGVGLGGGGVLGGGPSLGVDVMIVDDAAVGDEEAGGAVVPLSPAPKSGVMKRRRLRSRTVTKEPI